MSNQQNDIIYETIEEQAEEKEHAKRRTKGKSYCTCSDSHLVVPKSIDTAFCRYCQKPPLSKKPFDFIMQTNDHIFNSILNN